MENIHLAVLIITGLLIVTADHDAYLYILGKKQLLQKTKTKMLHYAVWAGLALMICTGIILALPFREYYLTDPAFLLKMCMVAALVCNGFLIGKLSSTAFRISFKDLSFAQRMSLLLSGSLSSVGWIGATVMGLFFL